MAPEAHGALVPADLDYGPKNMILPTKTGLSYMLYFINFLPSHMVEAVDAPKVYIYIYTLAGATQCCPGHYIKLIKCIMMGKGGKVG